MVQQRDICHKIIEYQLAFQTLSIPNYRNFLRSTGCRSRGWDDRQLWNFLNAAEAKNFKYLWLGGQTTLNTQPTGNETEAYVLLNARFAPK